MEKLRFLKTALRDYNVGAITPSSSHVTRRVAREIDVNFTYVVEYGPGNGVSTRAILQRMPANGRLVVIERNKHFLPVLKEIKDARLHIVEGDVRIISKQLDKLGLPRIDAVVSSIPFSFLPPPMRRAIVSATFRALAPRGKFIIYQYSPLMLSYLRPLFLTTRLRFEPRNLPPCFIMIGEKL